MIATHIDCRTEFLTDYKSLQRKRRVNGEYSLSFLLFKTERNEHSYPLTVEESLIEYDGQEYRVKKMVEKTIGNTPFKQIQADHTFFDLVDEYQYDEISGAKSLSVCLMHALNGADYKIVVVDSFPSVTFENYGNDNTLALIQIALNRFNAEIEINGKQLIFRHQIGRKTDIQFRYKHNIKTIEKFVDSSNLSTYIKGFGKQEEDGTYVVTAEYESPLSAYYGIRHAKPVRDERYTTYAGLLKRLEDDLQDVPDISFTLDVVELKKAGIVTEQLTLGDEIFVIYEPLNIDIIARVVEIVDNPEEPLSSQLTLANFRGSFLDSIADFQRTKDRLDGIFEGKEKLPFNVLDEAVQRATLALQSAQTELEFANGIIARDPRDPNRLMIITSTGIGISTDGGKTFKEAITADGFVLSAGAIGQLDVNNINVAGVIGAINDDDTLIINAANINLIGQVTFSMFDNGVKNTINGKTSSGDVSQIINQTTIDGGKVTITNNTDFKNIQFSAAAAQSTAAAAIGNLADISADNKVTPNEKLDLGREWDIITSERPAIIAQAVTYSASSATYTTAYNALNTYLTPILSSMSSTTTIVRDTFNTRFKNYYDEKIKLLNAITDKVKIIADGASDTVTVWRYPNTTLINGGSIKTDSIDVNRLIAGILTGFDIRSPTFAGGLVRINNGVVSNVYGNSSIQMTSRMHQGSQQSLIKLDDSSTGTSAEMTLAGSSLELYSSSGILALSAHMFTSMSGSLSVHQDLTVSGTKNASVPTTHGYVNVSAYETAEYYFGDIGRGVIVGGECTIDIESLFSETVNTNIDYEVFLTPYGPGQIYVDPDLMSPDDFVVKGDDIPFAWEIKAKRRNYEDIRLEATFESEVGSVEY